MTKSPSIVPLYPSEDEIARLILGENASEWPAKAVVLEREGLPKIDMMMGGRPWRLVEKFFMHRHGLDAPENAAANCTPTARVRVVAFAPDGPENPDAEGPRAYPDRRRSRGHERRART
jgi:hypothetical protein